MKGWQWHQLDHMQMIFTLLQTLSPANISSFNFYRTDALPDDQPTVSKHWRQSRNHVTGQMNKTKTRTSNLCICCTVFPMNVVASVAQTEIELNKTDKDSADLVVRQQCVRLSTEEVWIPDAKQRQDHWHLLTHIHTHGLWSDRQ